MFYVYFVVLAYFIKICDSLNYFVGWNYINIHCRDNQNAPVDWWYVYKPPTVIIPYLEPRSNFTYITPSTAGRWKFSEIYLTANSMLYHTLSPLFRRTYQDYRAVVAYEHKSDRKSGKQRTAAYGIMIADEMGGAWIGHTVPGLLDLAKDRPTIPRNEAANGHLMVCLSLDLVTLNKLATTLKQSRTKFTTIQIPPTLKERLPMWSILRLNIPIKRSVSPSILQFNTKGNSLHGFLMMRQPEDPNCLFQTFAQKNHIILDVYGHSHKRQPICEKDYGLRNIDSISIKSPYYVNYVKNISDRATFAVSTAAHWQRKGRGPEQYWACVSGYSDSTNKEPYILCAKGYDVWLSFDNFKVREPDC